VTQLYRVNSKGGPRAHSERYAPPSWYAAGEIMRTAYEAHAEDDDFAQPGNLVRDVMDDAARDRLIVAGAGPAAGTGRTIPVRGRSVRMRFTGYSFGSIRVDGVAYDHDLVIDRGKIRKRKKAASRRFRGRYGHTPLSAAEDIPWRCRRLVIGTGADGALPVLQQVREQARRRKIDLIVLPTAEAIGVLAQTTRDTNAILHLTC
jgi:hypothetical protein